MRVQDFPQASFGNAHAQKKVDSSASSPWRLFYCCDIINKVKIITIYKKEETQDE
ncbi:hypothetical protein UT300007_04920 [Clostridium sp. CTA-7]